jgi:hypothetical protein
VSKIRPGCIVKRFGERGTVRSFWEAVNSRVSVTSTHLAPTITNAIVDFAIPGVWVDSHDLVHAKSCPCRKESK